MENNPTQDHGSAFDWPPPDAYPVAMIRAGAVVTAISPDLGLTFNVTDFSEVATVIKAELRRRRLEREMMPFASSVESVALMHPDATIFEVITTGWENPGPLSPAGEDAE